jgi:small-conductance mechanosensitive channel
MGFLTALILLASMLPAILGTAGATAFAQDAEPPVTSPESLPQVFSEGSERVKEQIGSLRSVVKEKKDALAESEKQIADLRVSVATVKALLAISALPAHRVEEVVGVFDARKESLDAHTSQLEIDKETLVKEQTASAASMKTLDAEIGSLRSAGRNDVWTPEMEGAYEAYLQLARIRDHWLDLSMEALERRARLLREGQAVLEGIQPQLAGLKEAWKQEITKREAPLSVREQTAKVLQTLLALPDRARQWAGQVIRSGSLGAFIEKHLALLLGLLLVITLIGWACRRLSRTLCPQLRTWRIDAEDIGLQVFWSLTEILVCSLFSVGFALWLALIFQSLGLLKLDSARIILYAVSALVATRLSLRLVEGFFSGKEAGGALPLDGATAAFYRRYLKLLFIYFFLGILGLSAAGALGFQTASSTFLEHLFETVLQVLVLLVLRPRRMESLFMVLPGPSWRKWLKAAKIVRILVMSLLTAVILADLLGYQGLSVFMARSMTYSEGVILSWALVMLGMRVVLHFLLCPDHGWLARRAPDRAGLSTRFQAPAKRVLAVLLSAAAFLTILLAWGIKTDDLARILEGLTWGISLGPVRLTPLNVALAVMVLYFTGWLRRVIRSILDTRVLPRSGWDSGVQYTISMVLQYFIMFVGVLIAISVVGFPLTNLALVAGALGVGLGFGLQDIVKNFVSGLILLFERPIKVGDMLVIDGQWGEVKGIRMRSTVFQTFDKYVLIIPNSEMVSSKILNWTHFGRKPSRLTLKVGVSYDSDVAEVTRVLAEVCKQNPRVLDDPAPQIFFAAYGDSSLDFTVWVHVRLPEDRVPATHELNSAIFEAFREHSIEIPFPQRDLHVRTLPEGMSMGGSERPAGKGEEEK